MHRTISPEAGDALQSVARVHRTPSLNRPQPAGKKRASNREARKAGLEETNKHATMRSGQPMLVASNHPPDSNKEHALGERRRMALPGASVMSVARPTSVRHCAVTVKSMHGAFVLVVVGSQMCAVAHPGTHAPRGRRCCAGVTPGFQESCCCVQPINSGFRLQVFRSIVQRHAVRERLSREETTTRRFYPPSLRGS